MDHLDIRQWNSHGCGTVQRAHFSQTVSQINRNCLELLKGFNPPTTSIPQSNGPEIYILPNSIAVTSQEN